IAVGDGLKSASSHFEMEKHFFKTTQDLIDSEILETLRNEMVLVKGSRSFQFDDIAEIVELKVHETTLEINLNALINNLNYFRNKLDPETKIMCMVKASAYGAGAYEVAKTLRDHRVDYLAVAIVDEGAELRKAGVTGSIIVMNPDTSAFKTIFEHKLELEVYSFQLLEELIKTAEKTGTINVPIHIKLDTGMHRLGFSPKDIPKLIDRLHRQTSVMPRSIFSHLAGSDSTELDQFTQKQFRLFEASSQEFQAGFSHKILRHICNTSGIIRYPEAQYDMVRLGIGLYGIESFTNKVIHHIGTLKTTILQIKELEKEETVGYGCKGTLNKNSRIAAIRIGYADGLDRRLGNRKGYCLVNGKKAPYIGNICMDVAMIDVTDIACKAGDKAIIFGDELPVTMIADTLDTIPYEILTSISDRVKRIYYQE
ncbi:MAG: alanine racemase, partial [Phocaeicola sp.]